MEHQSPLRALQHWAKTRGSDAYLHQPDAEGKVTVFTWAEVYDKARRVASFIKSLGLPAHSNIVLTGENSAHWFIADLGIWMAGFVSVPVYPTLGEAQTKYVFEHCEAPLVFLGRLGDNWPKLRGVLPESIIKATMPHAPEGEGVAWDAIMAFDPIAEAEIDYRDLEALATIVYTSGTTGMPKGVMHCFRSMTAPCVCSEVLWKPSHEDRMLSYLPLAHIAERVAVEIPSVMFGFQVFFNWSLETFPADLKRARPTRFFTVPRLWTKFYQAVNAKLPPAKQRVLFSIPFLGKRIKRKILEQMGLDATEVALTGAAPISAELIKWYRGLGLELLEVFGMTENAASSHATRLGRVRPGYVGEPLPGVECKLSESGEVLVKSPGQMLGYYKADETTKNEMTDDGFFRTGDCGEISPEGLLKITGRVKELFKTSKGKYVAPVPIENAISSFPGIEMVCVSGAGQPQPYAMIVLSPAEIPFEKAAWEETLHTLRNEVNATLADHEKLAFIAVISEPWSIENGELTPTLKLRRSAIEGRYAPMAEAWQSADSSVVWH